MNQIINHPLKNLHTSLLTHVKMWLAVNITCRGKSHVVDLEVCVCTVNSSIASRHLHHGEFERCHDCHDAKSTRQTYVILCEDSLLLYRYIRDLAPESKPAANSVVHLFSGTFTHTCRR